LGSFCAPDRGKVAQGGGKKGGGYGNGAVREGKRKVQVGERRNRRHGTERKLGVKKLPTEGKKTGQRVKEKRPKFNKKLKKREKSISS